MNLTLDEVPKQEFFVVNADDPAAMSLVHKLCGAGRRPGQVIPINEDEFKALNSSFMRIQIPEKAPAANGGS